MINLEINWKRSVIIFDLEELEQELSELREEMNAPNFWDDQERAKKKSKLADRKEEKIITYKDLTEELEEIELLYELASEEDNEEELEELEERIARIEEQMDSFQLKLFMDGKFDDRDCYLGINAGAGGTDAQDWAGMLMRMYTRWLERNDFSYQTLEISEGEEAGVKSATLEIEGEWSFGYLKAEAGVHRLVRISPFDSAGRRHTSFASVNVTPQFEDDLEVQIDENDLRVDTFRASGAGGQHVNVTDSAVRITHEPTGLVATCQNERSQHKNRETAMKILKSRLYQLKMEKRAEKIEEVQGELKDIEWGSQIRSYVLHPYQKIKDHRTEVEVGDTESVLDGEIDPFIQAYLKKK
ncbi:peptide chain release factor 2 [Candidatus Bipolaricaulota bacterium]|nr:peptide chain release factor 2 [Candidatus Bipolaricaulota bacterium]